MYFFADEHLPITRLTPMLTVRGHTVKRVNVGFKDPAILILADQEDAVIITADTWFLKELFRFPTEHNKRYACAGVVQVAGEWDAAAERIGRFMGVIEEAHKTRRPEDLRFGIDLSEAQIRIVEGMPGPSRRKR